MATDVSSESATLAVSSKPRWLLVLAWSSGTAAAYALASLAHAALVERIWSVDVAFGRVLAFWVGTLYLALLGWGFLPARPRGWYARRALVWAALAVGLAGAAVSAVITGLWLGAHWIPAVGGPVVASIVVLLGLGAGMVWLVERDERRASAC